MSAGARPSAPEADSSGHGAGPAPPPAPAPGHGLPSVRLSWTGAALVIAGVVAVTAGELVRAAALTALGAMALVAVAAAAAVVVADWRRLGPRLTIDLAGGPRRVHVGQPVPIWLRATRSGPPLPPGRRRLRRSRPDRAGCRTVLVEDPADAWELWRRRGPVARPPTRRRRRRIPVEVDAPVPTGPAAVVPAVGRGSLRIGPLRAWLADPFGVVEVRLPATSAVTVLVGPPWPAPAPAPVPEPPVRRRPDEPGPPVGRAGRFGEELVGVSGMVAGEPPGRLHWPTSVRCGEPMVLRFAGRTGGDAPVVVHLDARAEVHDFGSFEAAVATAAAEAGAVLSQRRSLLLAGSGDPVLLRPGPNALRDLYDQLAVADLVDARRPQAGRGGRLERVGATTSPTGIRAGSVVVTSPTGASSLRSAPGPGSSSPAVPPIPLLRPSRAGGTAPTARGGTQRSDRSPSSSLPLRPPPPSWCCPCFGPRPRFSRPWRLRPASPGSSPPASATWSPPDSNGGLPCRSAHRPRGVLGLRLVTPGGPAVSGPGWGASPDSWPASPSPWSWPARWEPRRTPAGWPHRLRSPPGSPICGRRWPTAQCRPARPPG
jgi:hypothetical protein